MDPGLAVLISAAFATAGWLYNGRLQRLTGRRQHTYLIVLRQQDDEFYHAAIATLRQIGRKKLSKAAVKKLTVKQIEKLNYILNHYEFLSAAIWCGDVDEKLIRMCDESIIKALRDRLENYIDEVRAARAQPSMWEHMGALATRWDGHTRPRSTQLYELVLQRPCRDCPLWLRSVDLIIGPRLS